VLDRSPAAIDHPAPDDGPQATLTQRRRQVPLMADTIAPEFVRFVNNERRARRLPALPGAVATGEATRPVFVDPAAASELLRVAARRAVGLFRPTKRTEVVWVQGENELAINLADIQVKFGDGLVRVAIPVRCDQTGSAIVEVVFAVGAPNRPAGLFASTLRRPNGPALVVATWGEALVAFAWQCVLGLATGVAGATGKDQRGNVLVPAEVVASPDGLQVMPMARHRVAGSSGLRTTTTTPTLTAPTQAPR
jgi:hypothetical protein